MKKRYIFLNPKIFTTNIKNSSDKNNAFSFYYPGCSERLFQNNEADCAICLNKLSKDIARPENCEHFFCANCLILWNQIKKVCPLFRKNSDKIVLLS